MTIEKTIAIIKERIAQAEHYRKGAQSRGEKLIEKGNEGLADMEFAKADYCAGQANALKELLADIEK